MHPDEKLAIDGRGSGGKRAAEGTVHSRGAVGSCTAARLQDGTSDGCLGEEDANGSRSGCSALDAPPRIPSHFLLKSYQCTSIPHDREDPKRELRHHAAYLKWSSQDVEQVNVAGTASNG